jgi:putative transposase
MARLPRLVIPGLAHQVVLRGHGGQPVFRDDADRRLYLEALADALRTHRVALLGYALLDDEVRLLLVPPAADAIGRVLQAVGRRHGAAFNRRHGRRGALWDGRFRAGVVEPGLATLQCLCAIDTLPLRRGSVADPGAGCSSAAHRLGRGRDPLLSDPPEYWALGNTPFEREAAWSGWLQRGPDPQWLQRLDHAALHGWAVGGDAFVAQVAEKAGRPATPRRRGRPPGGRRR